MTQIRDRINIRRFGPSFFLKLADFLVRRLSFTRTTRIIGNSALGPPKPSRRQGKMGKSTARIKFT